VRRLFTNAVVRPAPYVARPPSRPSQIVWRASGPFLPPLDEVAIRCSMPHVSSPRSFLQLPLAAAALALTSKLSAATDEKAGDAARATKGIRVGANQDRHGEDLRIMGG
jgi:hypothetical protein